MRFRRGKPYRDAKNGGRYVAAWSLDGKRYRERTPFTTLNEVERLLDEKESRYYASNGTWTGGNTKLTVRAAIEQFEHEKRSLSRGARRQYNLVLDNFDRFCGDGRKVHNISKREVDDFIAAHRAHGVQPATLAADLRVLKVFARWCHEAGYTHRPFIDGAGKIKVPRKRPRTLPFDIIPAFLNGCSPGFRRIAIFAILTGLRRKDIVNARWDGIEDDGNGRHTYRFISSKTGEEEAQPLHPVLVAELASVPRIGEWIFPVTKDTTNHKGSVVRRGDKRSDETSWFNKQVKLAATKAGLDPSSIHLHGLRKTFGALCQRAGGDLWLTSKLLGHAEVTTTDRHYLPTDQDRTRQVVESIKLGSLDDGPKIGGDGEGGGDDRGASIVDFERERARRCHKPATTAWQQNQQGTKKPSKPA